ncbi:MAG: hypothetical protein L6Q99_15625 [Planctomycetes bacterium]|nr:hypothetical protein [Planctomycetota bacterium]
MSGRKIVLLLGVIFVGTPLVLIWLFVQAPPRDRVTVGVQPGGVARGVVVDARRTPVAGATIEAFLARPVSGAKSVEHDVEEPPELERRECATTTTDAEGQFELALPGGDGFYVLVARTPTTVRCERWLSLLDPPSASPLEFQLRSGARLTVELVNAGAAPQGFYDLSVVIQSGLMRLKEALPSSARGSFSAQEFTIESLPVSPVRLALDLPGGVRLERELSLAFGENRLVIDAAAR